jgi:hypothetical protein
MLLNCRARVYGISGTALTKLDAQELSVGRGGLHLLTLEHCVISSYLWLSNFLSRLNKSITNGRLNNNETKKRSLGHVEWLTGFSGRMRQFCYKTLSCFS